MRKKKKFIQACYCCNPDRFLGADELITYSLNELEKKKINNSEKTDIKLVS